MVTDTVRASVARRPAVLFDFDGTLANTGNAVVTTVRRVLGAHGFTPEEMGDLRRFIGPPLVDCFRDTCGFAQAEAERVAEEYRAVFAELGPADWPLMPGMAELVADLASAGKRLAVATSRKESSARSMVAALGLAEFEAVIGMNEAVGRHTKADSVRDALAALGLGADDAVLVGDTAHDIRGAHAEGVPCICVTFGAGATADLRAAGADGICADAPALRAALLGYDG